MQSVHSNDNRVGLSEVDNPIVGQIDGVPSGLVVRFKVRIDCVSPCLTRALHQMSALAW